jgi:hypothetical protein
VHVPPPSRCIHCALIPCNINVHAGTHTERQLFLFYQYIRKIRICLGWNKFWMEQIANCSI